MLSVLWIYISLQVQHHQLPLNNHSCMKKNTPFVNQYRNKHQDSMIFVCSNSSINIIFLLIELADQHGGDQVPPDVMQQYMRQIQQQQQQQQQREPPRQSTFSNTAHLKDLFAPPHEILYSGSFNDAKNYAQTNEKWLLVNIQDDSVFACHELNRDIWRDDTVQSVVACFYVFWQADVHTESGKQFSRLHNIQEYDDFPVIAIIDPRTGELVKKWNGKVNKLTLIDELQKYPDTHSLVDDYMRIPTAVTSTSSSSTSTSSSSQPLQQQQFQSPASGVDNDAEDEMIQAAIRASLQEHQRNYEDVDMLDQQQQQQQSTPVVQQQQQQPVQQQQQPEQPEQPEPPKRVEFILPEVDVSEYTVPEGGTRIQLVNGSKRTVHRVALNTPLAVVYRLFDNELEEKRAFRVTFAGKEIEPSLSKTLESEGMKNASFNLVYE
jgi:hypothetical protein